MAAVTFTKYLENVCGSFRQRFYIGVAGSTGNTLATDLHEVVSVNYNDATAITKIVPSGTINQTLTFTSTGSYSAVLVEVIGK